MINKLTQKVSDSKIEKSCNPFEERMKKRSFFKLT
jgi:hypothetical protein